MAGTSCIATNGNNSTGTGTITNPFATISPACLNSTVYADLTAGNHVTNDARTPCSGAYDMGANEP
jgi:phage-related tail fiber protein